MKTLTGYDFFEDLVNTQITWNGENYSPSDLLLLDRQTIIEIKAVIELKIQWVKEKMNLAASDPSKPSGYPYWVRQQKAQLNAMAAHYATINNALSEIKKAKAEKTKLKQLLNYKRDTKKAAELSPSQVVFRNAFFLASQSFLEKTFFDKICARAKTLIESNG